MTDPKRKMVCYRCGRTPWDRALYRVNEKGVEGIWACEECLPPEKAPDPEVKAIMDLLR